MEKNGKGFDRENNIIYKIKNGNGYIKELDDFDRLLFEGDYLNGQKTGKWKEYYINGNIRYEGEYLNGKKHGKGKEYNDSGKLRFEGEYLYY